MEHAPYDAIILPGGGVRPDGSMPETTAKRLDVATDLLQNDEARAVIVCGAKPYKAQESFSESEAQAYANYLYAHGLPSKKVFLETKSQDTIGNILFAKTQILMPHNWHTIIVIPTQNHSASRITYILRKVLGPDYHWHIEWAVKNEDSSNAEREAKSLALTRELNDQYVDGDHAAIQAELFRSHPAYGGARWTIAELREKLGT